MEIKKIYIIFEFDRKPYLKIYIYYNEKEVESEIYNHFEIIYTRN